MSFNFQLWLDHTAQQRVKKAHLAKAAAKAQRSCLRHGFMALRQFVEQSQEMADASEGFLQESEVGPMICMPMTGSLPRLCMLVASLKQAQRRHHCSYASAL